MEKRCCDKTIESNRWAIFLSTSNPEDNCLSGIIVILLLCGVIISGRLYYSAIWSWNSCYIHSLVDVFMYLLFAWKNIWLT